MACLQSRVGAAVSPLAATPQIVELRTTRSVEAVANSSAVPKQAVAYVAVRPVAMSADPSNDNYVLGGKKNAHEVDPHCPLASQHSPNVDPTQVVRVSSTIPQRPVRGNGERENFWQSVIGIGLQSLTGLARVHVTSLQQYNARFRPQSCSSLAQRPDSCGRKLEVSARSDRETPDKNPKCWTSAVVYNAQDQSPSTGASTA